VELCAKAAANRVDHAISFAGRNVDHVATM